MIRAQSRVASPEWIPQHIEITYDTAWIEGSDGWRQNLSTLENLQRLWKEMIQEPDLMHR
jgi:hypothetical protein